VSVSAASRFLASEANAIVPLDVVGQRVPARHHGRDRELACVGAHRQSGDLVSLPPVDHADRFGVSHDVE
jgi:hypothetical protein